MISPVCIPQKHPEEASKDAAQARGERVGAGQDGDTRKSKSAGLTKAQRPPLSAAASVGTCTQPCR